MPEVLGGAGVSYTVYLTVDLGGPDPSRIECDDYLNYTYNVWGMFRLALGGDCLNDLDRMDAGAAAERLGPAITAMRADPSTYRAMNPPNGWGDYEGAVQFLERCRATFVMHPRATVRVG